MPKQARLDPSRTRVEPPRPRPYSAGVRKIGPTREAATRLVDFESAPFPYTGPMPGSGRPFLDVASGDRKGHRSSRGRVFWEDETFRDRRVLLHVPTGFNIDKPGLMVLFFHGHGAKIERDVRDRQLLPAQINAAGVNAVLMAPQFAIDAADSSAGRFWEPGGCERFRREAAQKFARIYGDPASEQAFLKMPMVIMAYSGGYAPAASCLRNGHLTAEVRGIVLFDALYGEFDLYKNWVLKNRSGFFLSTYTGSTQRLNEELDRQLNDQEIDTRSAMAGYNGRGRVTFVKVPPDADHRSLLTKAWVKNPVRDMMAKFDDLRVNSPGPRLAGQ